MSAALNRSIHNLEIDPHTSDQAIVLRYDHVDDVGTTIKKSKIIQLKNFSDTLDPSALARTIQEQCSYIASERLSDLEQTIFYLQRRLHAKHEIFGAGNNLSAFAAKSEIVNIEEYIEMLYDDGEKLKASALILSLALRPSRLKTLAENDVLIGVVTRVFREDSRKNLELGKNIASIFTQLSMFTIFHPLLSHHKIGAISLQLLEGELRRYEAWCANAATTSGEQHRKLELAIRKQELLIVECLKILINLSTEVRNEAKMVRRGLLNVLVECLGHGHSALVRKTAALFLWKLSVFVETKEAITTLGIVERVVQLLAASPTSTNAAAMSYDAEMMDICFALLFNLSFDSTLRSRMANVALLNCVAAQISSNEIALALLYQLSLADDAKAMFSFTDSIATLLKLLQSRGPALVIKGILINVATEKRNAQLICGPDGAGIDGIIRRALDEGDQMLMKIARNVATHEGPIQQHFGKWAQPLLDALQAASGTPLNVTPVDALAIVAQLDSVSWSTTVDAPALVDWMHECLRNSNEHSTRYLPDEFLLYLVVFCGTIAAEEACARLLLPLIDDLIALLNRKQEDDEFVLQIAFCLARIAAQNTLLPKICAEHENLIEYLINLSHDDNAQLCVLCDSALQLVSEVDERWYKRIAEERFRWHNAQWLEVVSGGRTRNGDINDGLSDDDYDQDDESFLTEQFRNAVLNAEDLLGEDQPLEAGCISE